VKFSTEIVTTQAPPKTPPRSEVRAPAALPSSVRRKRINADEQVIQDPWLTSQTSPDAPPFTADPQVTTRSARKKERAKIPRVTVSKGKAATPARIRKLPRPSNLPVPPNKPRESVTKDIRQKTQTAPQKTPTQIEDEREKKKKKVITKP
jgi:hypothetical protein